MHPGISKSKGGKAHDSSKNAGLIATRTAFVRGRNAAADGRVAGLVVPAGLIIIVPAGLIVIVPARRARGPTRGEVQRGRVRGGRVRGRPVVLKVRGQVDFILDGTVLRRKTLSRGC